MKKSVLCASSVLIRMGYVHGVEQIETMDEYVLKELNRAKAGGETGDSNEDREHFTHMVRYRTITIGTTIATVAFASWSSNQEKTFGNKTVLVHTSPKKNETYTILFPIVDFLLKMKRKFPGRPNPYSYRVTNLQASYIYFMHSKQSSMRQRGRKRI